MPCRYKESASCGSNCPIGTVARAQADACRRPRRCRRFRRRPRRPPRSTTSPPAHVITIGPDATPTAQPCQKRLQRLARAPNTVRADALALLRPPSAHHATQRTPSAPRLQPGASQPHPPRLPSARAGENTEETPNRGPCWPGGCLCAPLIFLLPSSTRIVWSPSRIGWIIWMSTSLSWLHRRSTSLAGDLHRVSAL